ncbi:hypothetical protein F0562_025584 [Nyssa sinensis]|uniref:Uncharacterized protein n=1 Tax=Nyssa sinensis TaxID=561372 RepID=A0A5J5BAB7_9ASTE|nr:hypothetical protein F0562_025584 [Nyssa sinensis]
MVGTLCKSFSAELVGCKIASMVKQTAARLEVNSSGSSSPISGTPERSRAVAETSSARHIGSSDLLARLGLIWPKLWPGLAGIWLSSHSNQLWDKAGNLQ